MKNIFLPLNTFLNSFLRKRMKSLYLLATLIFIYIYSCREKKEITKEGDITVPLTTRFEGSPLGMTYTPFNFLDSIPPVFSGIINNDSCFIGHISTIGTDISAEGFKRLKTDGVFTNKDPLDIYCLSGYKNGKQFYVLDENSNFDFSDDSMIEFDKGLGFNPIGDDTLRNKFPLFSIKVAKIERGEAYNDTIGIRIQPHPNYFDYSSKAKDKTEDMKRKLLISGRFEDYLYGSFMIKDSIYEIAVDKYSWSGPEIVLNNIEKGFYPFGNPNREIYTSKDTLKLADSYFRIEDIKYYPPGLKLKKLEINEDIVYGFRKGYTSKNYQVKDLDGHVSFLADLFGKNDILLIDFWGTWCAPCKELTPALVALNIKYGSILSMASLAFQQETEPIKNYIHDNQMTWYNGIIEGVPKTINPSADIIKNLRINTFPTFIILDSNLRILYRGTGGNFEKMKDFLEQYSQKVAN